MILFNFPEERSTPFNIYIPPDLHEQVKEQLHRRLKAELHRRTFGKLLKKRSQAELFSKEHIEDYLGSIRNFYDYLRKQEDVAVTNPVKRGSLLRLSKTLPE